MRAHYWPLAGCPADRARNSSKSRDSRRFREHQTHSKMATNKITNINTTPSEIAAIDASFNKNSVTSNVTVRWFPATSTAVIVTRVTQHDDVYVAFTSLLVPTTNALRMVRPAGFDWMRRMPVSRSCVVTSSDQTALAHWPGPVL